MINDYIRVSPRHVVGPITGPEKAKFLEEGPKIRKNLLISKKRAWPKKPRINPVNIEPCYFVRFIIHDHKLQQLKTKKLY